MLWLALHLPLLPLEAVAGDDAVPRVVADRMVRVANPAARAAGVQLGMTAATAQSLAPDIVTVPPDPARDRRVLEGLALHLWTVTSLITLMPESPALLGEMDGSARLFGGVPPAIDAALAGMAAAGVTVQWAASPAPAAALLLARERPGTIASSMERQRLALDTLPVHCLPFSQKVIEALMRLGLRRTSEVLQLPRAGLQRRFGTDIVRQLDQLTGAAPDPRLRWSPPARFDRRMEWPVPVEAMEALVFPLRRLAGEMAAYLSVRGQLATAILVTLEHEGRADTAIEVRAASGTGDAEHLLVLITNRLATITLAGPVRALRLQLVAEREVPLGSAALFDDPTTQGERT